MTGNAQPQLSSVPNPPLGGAIEVPYGTDRFQVRLHRLPAGAVLAKFPQAGITLSENILISGSIALRQAKGSQQPVMGQRFVLEAPAEAVLSNPGETSAVLLEVCWGEGFTPVPLAEVTETRPWGSFTVLKDEPDYKLKQLTVKPGNRLSLQRHEKREEHWFITQGDPEVTLNDDTHLLGEKQYIHIPRHSWHRITNPGVGAGVEVELIELQLGDYFGEDDIERKQDDYGRV